MKAHIATGIAALTGFALVASTVAVMGAHGARETITVNFGDSIVPRFSINTDSVLKVAGTAIVAKKCGTSSIYLRTWRKTTQLSADTVSVNVICNGGGGSGSTAPVTTESAKSCLFPNKDSVAKYQVRGDTTVDPKLVPCDSVSGTLSPSTATPLMRKA